MDGTWPARGLKLPTAIGLLIRFTYPNDIRGTSFLVWEHPAAEDERFLFLPSLGRVRRIAGSETQDSFVGSDFTYEDIGGREFDDYLYRSPRTANGRRGHRLPGDRARPAWRLESRLKDGAGQFPRVVSLILQDSFVVVEADIFNRRNERQKVYAVRTARAGGRHLDRDGFRDEQRAREDEDRARRRAGGL